MVFCALANADDADCLALSAAVFVSVEAKRRAAAELLNVCWRHEARTT